MRARVVLALSTVLALLALLTLPASHSVADACGMVWPQKIAPELRPSLSWEKVLIVYDEAKGQEHFIREVAFNRAAEPLGFVVPTPTRPEVAAVAKTPFTRLRSRMSFEEQGIGLGDKGTVGSGYGRGSGAGFGGGVTVLAEEQVGSFKAYTLAATDEAALKGWLTDNGFAASEGMTAWLSHYVQLGFYYVALRYDPPRPNKKAKKKKSKKKTSRNKHRIGAETIRISFATPLPFYPYLEPNEPALKEQAPRLMELWYVGSSATVPVALREADGAREWVRPLRAGVQYDGAEQTLQRITDSEISDLLPSGELVVQTFQDQKRTRPGFGDMVFVPKQRREPNAQTVAALAALLDPSLATQGGGQ